MMLFESSFFQRALQSDFIGPLLFSLLFQTTVFQAARLRWPNTFHSTKQIGWILTTLSSIIMTAASLPFVYDYFSNGTNVSRMALMNDSMARVFCGYFVAYMIMDLVLGSLYYSDQIDPLTGWTHHILHIGVVLFCVTQNIPGGFLLVSFLELPTIFLSIGSIFKSLRSEYLFGSTFLMTRILFHIVFAIRVFQVWPEKTGFVVVSGMTLPLHLFWFYRWLRRQITLLNKNKALLGTQEIIFDDYEPVKEKEDDSLFITSSSRSSSSSGCGLHDLDSFHGSDEQIPLNADLNKKHAFDYSGLNVMSNVGPRDSKLEFPELKETLLPQSLSCNTSAATSIHISPTRSSASSDVRYRFHVE